MMIEDERTGTWHAYRNSAPGQPQSRFDYRSFIGQYQPTSSNTDTPPGTSCFSAYLTQHFPDVVAKVNTTGLGVLQFEAGALKLATQEAIQKRDWATVATHFAFIDNVLEAADIELHKTIGVSYLVNLFYGETSINFAKARTLMPKRLANALEIIERHYEELKK
jgi:hypothetical protein